MSLLRRGIHHNQHLQSAWLNDGEENFSFEIVMTCDTDCLLSEEEKMINETNADDRTVGYNKTNNTTSPMLGKKHSASSLAKMVEAKLGDKNSFYGRTHTDETKEKISKARTGVPLTEEHREKVLQTAYKSGVNNRNSKLTMDQVNEIRLLASDYYKVKKSYWGFATMVSKIYGVHRSTIKRVIENKTYSNGGNDE